MTPRVLISSSGMISIAHLRFARLVIGRALRGPGGAPWNEDEFGRLPSEDARIITASRDDLVSGRRLPPRVAICSIECPRRAPCRPPAASARRAQAGVCMTLADPSVVTDQPSASRNRLVLIVYTADIFVSALLLFSVQPLFTKMVLPRLGGSPAVWSVAMVFFQSLLLAGYAYAHFLMQLRNRMLPVAIHLVLLACAMLTLPLSISSGWGDPPNSGYALWLLGL